MKGKDYIVFLLTILVHGAVFSQIIPDTAVFKEVKDSAGVRVFLNGSPNSGKIIINVNTLPSDGSTSGKSGKKKAKIYNDTLARESWAISGATYNNILTIKDNDPPGFVQYDVCVSLPFKPHGRLIDTNSNEYNHFIPFRNVYVEGLYSPNAVKYDSVITTIHNERLANRLDLLQYATLNVMTYWNIMTLIIPDDGFEVRRAPKEMFHLYGDVMLGFLVTQDSIHDKPNPLSVPSAVWGIHLDLMSKQAISKDFTMDLGVKFFMIRPFSSSIEPYLNPQIHNIQDTALAGNSKEFQRTPNPLYFNINGLISTTLLSNLLVKSTSTEKPVTVYLHADVYSDFLNSHKIDNTYFQVQLGAVLNFNTGK